MRLLQLEVHNFLSFGPGVVVNFGSNSPYLVKGITKTGDDSNGSGKSSLFEAIYWCFTGKTIRKVGSKDVIRFGQKATRVKVVVKINDKIIEVTRELSGTKKKITINNDGKLQTYHTVKDGTTDLFEILGTDGTLLALACFYGRRYLTFSQMSSTHRADLLSSLSKTADWERCEALTRANLSDYNKKLADKNTVIRVKQENVNSLTLDIRDLKSSINSYNTKNKETLDGLQEDLILFESSLPDFDLKIKEIQESLEKESNSIHIDGIHDEIKECEVNLKKSNANTLSIKESIFKIGNICDSTQNEITKKQQQIDSVIPQQIDNFKKEIDKYNHLLSGTCPTCEQEIRNNDNVSKWKDSIVTLKNNIEEKNSQIETYKVDITELDNTLSKQKNSRVDLQEQHTKSLAVTEKIEEQLKILKDSKYQKEKKQRKLYEELNKLQNERNECLACISDIKNEQSNYSNHLSDLQTKLNLNESRILVLNDELSTEEEEKLVIQQEIYKLKYWRDGFKSIRFGVFSDLCAFLESLLNEFLKQQDLDFDSVNIITSREKVAGGEKSCVDIVITRNGIEIPLGALSEGETQRVDIACYIALSELISNVSGFSPDLLVMDEPLTGIDAAGKKKVFDLINGMASKKQIFVIDHNADFSDMFTGIIEVAKSEYSTVSIL